MVRRSYHCTGPITAKLHVEHPYEGGNERCINGPGHITKMAAMDINSKTLKIFSRTRRPLILKLGMNHQWRRDAQLSITDLDSFDR